MLPDIVSNRSSVTLNNTFKTDKIGGAKAEVVAMEGVAYGFS